jgi:single-strand DNA-binding protein
MSTPVTIVGRLGSDPEIRFTQAGKAVASLSVVTSKKTKNPDGSWGEDTEVTWYDVSVWEEFGENVVESLTKGDPVIVSGRLYMDTYQGKDGQERRSLKVAAYHVGPDLKWGAWSKRGASNNSAPRSAPRPAAVEDPWAPPVQEDIPPF